MNLLAGRFVLLQSVLYQRFQCRSTSKQTFCAHAVGNNINNCYPLEHTALSTLWFSLGTSRAVGDSRSDAARKLFSG